MKQKQARRTRKSIREGYILYYVKAILALLVRPSPSDGLLDLDSQFPNPWELFTVATLIQGTLERNSGEKHVDQGEKLKEKNKKIGISRF